MVTFDAATHRYFRDDGIEVPGVTAVLGATGLKASFGFVAPEVLASARDRGARIHAATADYDSFGDWGRDPADDGFVLRWSELRAGQGWHRTKLCEELVWYENGQGAPIFAGTVDRVFEAPHDTWAVVDLSLGDLGANGKRFQTAAYAAAVKQRLDADGHRQIRRFGVRLFADKPAEVVPYRDWRDLQVFMAALTVYGHQVR